MVLTSTRDPLEKKRKTFSFDQSGGMFLYFVCNKFNKNNWYLFLYNKITQSKLNRSVKIPFDLRFTFISI